MVYSSLVFKSNEFSPHPLLLTFYCLPSLIDVSFLPKVVFITALFYLLCYSEEDYLPVKWVTDLLPNITAGSTEDYGKAFSRAIRYQSCDQSCDIQCVM